MLILPIRPKNSLYLTYSPGWDPDYEQAMRTRFLRAIITERQNRDQQILLINFRYLSHINKTTTDFKRSYQMPDKIAYSIHIIEYAIYNKTESLIFILQLPLRD